MKNNNKPNNADIHQKQYNEFRCPACNKITTPVFDDPELNSFEFDEGDGSVEVAVNLSLSSACCGRILKEGMLTFVDGLSDDVVADHTGEDHHLTVEHDGIEVRNGDKVTPYGAGMTVHLHCSCGEELEELYLEDFLSIKEMQNPK